MSRPTSPLLTLTRDVSAAWKKNGWAHLRGTDYLMDPRLRVAFADLVRETRALPIDRRDRTGTRRRRFWRYTYLPWTGQLIIEPPKPYQQDPALNPEAKGKKRVFAGATTRLARNPVLDQLIALDLETAGPVVEGWRDAPVAVELHLITHDPRKGIPAVTSPNTWHQDGHDPEQVFFIHLLARENVIGGRSAVAADVEGQKVLTELDLVDPLDTLCVTDRKVWHRVTPVELVQGYTQGLRAVAIIDLQPYRKL